MIARGSLSRRLMLAALLWAAVLLVGGGFAATRLYSGAVLNAFDDRLDEVLESVLSAVDVGADGEPELARDLAAPRYQRVLSGHYWALFDLQEAPRVVLRSGSLSDSDFGLDEMFVLSEPSAELALDRTVEGVVSGSADGPEGERLRVRMQRIMLPGSDRLWLAVVAADRAPVDQATRRFAVVAIWGFAGMAAALLFAIGLQVRLGLSPVYRMQSHVAEIRQGGRERLTGSAPKELAPLGQELNALIDHNRDVVERARTHVGNLAHALKTPLSVMIADARDKDTPLAHQVRKQADIMRHQVDHHLQRARAAARAQTIGARTPVRPVLEELRRTLLKIFQEKDVAVELQVSEELAFRGERQDLQELAGNLLDNAFKWCRRTIHIKAESHSADMLRIFVEDDGPGVDEAELQAALKRGERLDESVPGTGLGLAIVNDLARAYGGQVQLSRSSLGGLKVELVLPMSVTAGSIRR